MDLKTEKIIAYCLAIGLFVVGVVCYAAFPVKAPEEPIRIMLKNTAGNVLFDHKMHTSEDGYGYGCVDCHHLWENDGKKPEACGECHMTDGEDPIKRSEAFHQQCIGCHENDGTAPTLCAACHIP
jgi:hypothetical protein